MLDCYWIRYLLFHNGLPSFRAISLWRQKEIWKTENTFLEKFAKPRQAGKPKTFRGFLRKKAAENRCQSIREWTVSVVLDGNFATHKICRNSTLRNRKHGQHLLVPPCTLSGNSRHFLLSLSLKETAAKFIIRSNGLQSCRSIRTDSSLWNLRKLYRCQIMGKFVCDRNTVRIIVKSRQNKSRVKRKRNPTAGRLSDSRFLTFRDFSKSGFAILDNIFIQSINPLIWMQ